MVFGEIRERNRNYRDRWLKICRYYAINYTFFEMELHTHPEWELMYVVQGRCRVAWMEGEQERNRDFRSGEYILLAGGAAHRLEIERERFCRIMNLEGRLENAKSGYRLGMLEGDAQAGALLKQNGSVLTGKDDGRLYDTVAALLEELRIRDGCGDAMEHPMLELLLGQFFLILARQNALDQKRCGTLTYIRRAQEYLEEHFDQEITVAAAAKAAGISQGYLQRLYKTETGISLMEQVLRLRVEKAQLLLEISTLPVIDIAVSVGFNSRQHFSATFWRLTGCSPAEWRKRRGGSDKANWIDVPDSRSVG